MQMPYGEVKDTVLELRFSSADYSVASVMAACREHLDKLNEMQVQFLGTSTELGAGTGGVFRPVDIVAQFEYTGRGDVQETLERAYLTVWQGIVATFPSEDVWATSKEAFGAYIRAQADLLRARAEVNRATREED